MALALLLTLGRLQNLDKDIELSVHRNVTASLRPLMDLASVLGSETVTVSAALILSLLLLAMRRYLWSLFLCASAGGASAVGVLLKALFHRRRPHLWTHAVLPQSHSFPSGHAMSAAAFATAITYLVWAGWGRKAGIVAVLTLSCFCALVGFSRIYLGAHWPSDVLAGYSASILWVTLLALNLRPFRRRSPAPTT